MIAYIRYYLFDIPSTPAKMVAFVVFAAVFFFLAYLGNLLAVTAFPGVKIAAILIPGWIVLSGVAWYVKMALK